MNTTTALSPAVLPRRHALLRHTGLALSGSLLVAISAHISFPLFFTPVPFTLQPLAVLAIGLLLGPAIAFSSLSLYLLEAMAALPVLAPMGAPGPLHIFGPTGGYIIAFPFVAALAGWLYSRGRRMPLLSNFAAALIAAAVADLLLLTSGSAGLMTLLHLSPAHAFEFGMVPFLPGEGLKVAAAAALAAGFTRLRQPNTSAE
ncbi:MULTISPECIES: biotin transporter BioY [Acidobacterium]|uniref:BioY family protein n=1 Tax=Acidobacterium capsulatum (strain ATCC 51196 / DSM 11244 / BCRC 80197 / JCM 7670 / NBRC 15755 / NCIMB 13165 / 161) TaxID=240015 RepID=C1F8L0_ACIC5|nr:MULTISPECIES: biotin transporter BioY [Acidobacterium]ACO32711.1 BioY family protein [Acidobacterium capsulatum ATCC 51196]HCT61511.1 biotin transporter BioY [Acidobacterium sp.]